MYSRSSIKLSQEGTKNMRFQIGSRWISDSSAVFVIAEIGINHQGDPALAHRLIDAAAWAGADAVKFQKRTINAVLCRSHLNMPYNHRNSFGATYGEHRQALELSNETYAKLKKHAEAEGLIFFASAWDTESTDVLDAMGVPVFKVASADLTNLPLLEYLASKQKALLISTGMSTLDEIDRAVQIIRSYGNPFALLQCTASYPAAFNEINLRAIPMLRDRYGCIVGYSGHELGINVSIAAVALGARIIERHLTLDHTMKGSDHIASLEPQELEQLVRGIREVEQALGKPEKHIWPSEFPNKEKLSKSVVSLCFIRSGTVLTKQMLTLKSPGIGIPAARFSDVAGRVAAHDIEADCILQEEDFLPMEQFQFDLQGSVFDAKGSRVGD